MNVWCGILNNKIIGPYFYKENLTAERYLSFLQHNLENYLDELPLKTVRDLIFQHDEAPAHTSRIVKQYLLNQFKENLIINDDPIHYPAQSPDLTPLDLFMGPN